MWFSCRQAGRSCRPQRLAIIYCGVALLAIISAVRSSAVPPPPVSVRSVKPYVALSLPQYQGCLSPERHHLLSLHFISWSWDSFAKLALLLFKIHFEVIFFTADRITVSDSRFTNCWAWQHNFTMIAISVHIKLQRHHTTAVHIRALNACHPFVNYAFILLYTDTDWDEFEFVY